VKKGKMKAYTEDIYEIIRTGNEEEIKKIVIRILKSIINGTENKDEVSYFPDYLVTVPLLLKKKTIPYKVKDKILNNALNIIANFEGDSLTEAVEKSKKLLKELKAKK
jgi:hypothetical protein